MTLEHLLADLALGAFFGFAGSVFGIGGGSIAIPVLGIFFGMSEQVAQGTALVMVVPNVVVALWGYARRNALDPRIVTALVLGAIPATIAGARLATLVPSTTLRIAFVGFMLVLAGDLARRTFGRPPARRTVATWPWAFPLGAFGGIVSGVFSIGGATAIVPSLIAYFGCSQVAAQGLALAFALPSALFSTIVFGLAGDVDWSAAIPLAIGGVVTVRFGVALAHRLPERQLRIGFIVYMLVVAAGLAVKAHASG